MKRISRILLTMICLSVLIISFVSAGCGLMRESSGGHGILNLYGSTPLTLDPALSLDSSSHGYIVQIFSGLVRLDEKLEPVADIASDWQISSDGLVYTFNLREDVSFQNGSKVDAYTFKYSWERACSPITGSQTAETYLGDIKGVHDMLFGSALDLSGVQVIDDYRLQVTLEKPCMAFLFKLTYPTAYALDKKNVESGKDWWKKPNGTGPFKLYSYVEEKQLVLEHNSLYYGNKAKLNKVIFKLLAGIPINMYEAGEIDVADVSIAFYDRVTDASGSFSSQLVLTPSLSLTYLGFDITKAPFDDPLIRQAFSIAVDKEKIAKLMFRDVVAATGGILPPGMPGYNTSLTTLSYSVEDAKTLIAQSKYGSAANLPEIVVTVSGYGGTIPSDLEAIIFDWNTVFGIEIQVRQIDPMLYNYNLQQEKDNMYYWGWIADYANPQNFLEVLFSTGATYNIGGYSNPQVDSLLSQAASSVAINTSLALYQQAEQLIINDVACIPLWAGIEMQLVKSYVKGYQMNALGLVPLNEVYVVQ
ncbi:MAG: peptide ABC transporter substrate-binding protein [Dehalococcoidia bacterium]|nr:peptide ABC transporter substrate-binding protein [Dehalococcoidia bacterium]